MQSVRHLRDRLVFEGFVVQNGHRTGQVGFTDNTITHDHNFVQILGIILEGDGQGTLIIDSYFFGNIADIRDFQFGVGSHLNGKLTIQIGNTTIGRALFDNIGTNDRFAIRIRHGTCYRNGLLLNTHHTDGRQLIGFA